MRARTLPDAADGKRKRETETRDERRVVVVEKDSAAPAGHTGETEAAFVKARPLETSFKEEPEPSVVDPAEAVRAAMAAARARGGGSFGGGNPPENARRRTMFEGSSMKNGNAGNYGLESCSESEVLALLRKFRSNDFLGVLGFPGAPVDDRGRCDWKNHPVYKPGDVAMRSKVLSLRLDPNAKGAHALASEARSAVLETAERLLDPEKRKTVLTLAARERVDEMRARNVGDVRGGYVSMTGVHYAAGAAAARIASDDALRGTGEGPAVDPARRRRPVAAGAETERPGEPRNVAGTAAGDRTGEVEWNPESGSTRGTKTAVDLGSVRDKLKKKKKTPRFM